MRKKAEKFGAVSECSAHDNHVFLEFEEASACEIAVDSGLHGLVSNPDLHPTSDLAFFPLELWRKNNFDFCPIHE